MHGIVASKTSPVREGLKGSIIQTAALHSKANALILRVYKGKSLVRSVGMLETV